MKDGLSERFTKGTGFVERGKNGSGDRKSVVFFCCMKYYTYLCIKYNGYGNRSQNCDRFKSSGMD